MKKTPKKKVYISFGTQLNFLAALALIGIVLLEAAAIIQIVVKVWGV